MSDLAAAAGQRWSVAVVGASGAVGAALLTVLEERAFPVAELHALGRADTDDDTLVFANRSVRVKPLAKFDFGRCQLAIFCAPAAVAAEHVPRALAAGCLVIDLSSQFRTDPTVPLVVPDINAALLQGRDGGGLIAAPGAPASQLATVLAPLQRAAGLLEVQVTTQLAVSARGRAGIDELAGQAARLLNAQPFKRRIFPAQIAFNLFPSFDAPQENGYTLEELQTAAEVKKLLADEELVIDVTELFVPVFYGHSQVVRLRTRQPLTPVQARKLLRKTPGVKLVDGAGKCLSPVGDSTGSDAVLVGRIGQPADRPDWLTLWVVADNVRKSAAVNTVQIAEILLKPQT
jgi:aspartate-semialdehyde dehydrogenase